MNTLLAIEPDKIEHNNLSTLSYSPDLDMIPFYSYKNCLSNYSNKILVVKTHMNYVSTFNKVICLYRDPVDVFKSYFNMLKSYDLINESFYKFIRGQKGVKNYIKFYESYLNAPQSSRILFVNYQNIVHEVNTVKDILFLMFGVVISYEKIEAIMQYKKKEAAISIEDKYQEYDLRSQNSNFKFINNRIYLNEIDGNDIEYIKDKTKHISSLFDKNKH